MHSVRSDRYKLVLVMGTCCLLLQELNHVMLWLLTFNTPWKEFWVENRKRNSVLWEKWAEQAFEWLNIFRS